ncbi:MAG TPA: glycoside hydrolase family 2 TIM barrel-domain containing protein [Lacunisphaera sp.]|jgi:beta-galactosidase|nr:glycoside hydrolase family 2 TIM barrel-domain containing protein [Lacunisphaera sp.]
MRAFFPLCLALLAAAGGFAQPRDVVPVRSGPSTLSLDGAWQFKYVAGSELGPDVLFSDPDLGSTHDWPQITVPGNWELQGFAPPRYGLALAEGNGLYRRSFRVPPAWRGQRIFLHFDGVLYGFDAWVNGTKVGSWASGYNPAAFDITDALHPLSENIVAVRVTTRSHAWEFDVNDCWALSGIYRDVTLFAVPAAHLIDWTTRTQLQPDGSAAVTVAARLSAPSVVSGRLIAPDGRVVVLPFPPAMGGAVTARITVPHPQLWTAETPALYTVELTLASGQVLSERVGLREVTIRDGVLLVNGRPVKLRGIDHHDLWPEQGRAATEALMRRDLELMRAANINFIRTSHYPPHPRFLELCDELGFYVMDEVPFGFGEKHLTDPAFQDDLLTRARATVARDHNRACVIVWSVGNENPNTPLTFATARRVKELDPTRPVCFPQIGSYFARSHDELPADIDIYAPHYPSTTTVRQYAETLARPVIFTEYAHQLGLAAEGVQAQWPVMQSSPRLAGGAIWMFQDQGILRAAAAGETPGSTHNLDLAVWPDPKHYYDTNGNLGMDGIVYADRMPQVDYWQVRKVYSPVQLACAEPAVHPGANRLLVRVENRFDFRSLAGMQLAWTIRRNGAETAAGVIPLHAAAHATEEVGVPFDWPADAADDFAWIEVHCRDERGESFHERSFRLAPSNAVRPLAKLLSELPARPLQLVESAESFRVVHPAFALSLDRRTGEFALRDPAGTLLARGPWPHAGRRLTEGERVRAAKEHTWTEALLQAPAGVETSAVRDGDGIVLKVHGRYARTSAPDEFLEGETDLRVSPDGTIAGEYTFTPVNARGLLTEAGVGFLVPGAASEFQWYGDGPFAGYPGKDALDEFGRHHLDRASLYFQGNRRGVDIALLSTPAGAGLALGGEAMNVAVERSGEDTILSHNAVVSGRGTKFNGPDDAVDAATVGPIKGAFVVLPLGASWPRRLTSWFGSPSTTEVFAPYFHSYDQ